MSIKEDLYCTIILIVLVEKKKKKYQMRNRQKANVRHFRDEEERRKNRFNFFTYICRLLSHIWKIQTMSFLKDALSVISWIIHFINLVKNKWWVLNVKTLLFFSDRNTTRLFAHKNYDWHLTNWQISEYFTLKFNNALIQIKEDYGYFHV